MSVSIYTSKRTIYIVITRIESIPLSKRYALKRALKYEARRRGRMRERESVRMLIVLKESLSRNNHNRKGKNQLVIHMIQLSFFNTADYVRCVQTMRHT